MTKHFTNTIRSERHYATMLLPHLLMADNFTGLRVLFTHLGIEWDTEQDIEAVAELNPIRDVLRFEKNLALNTDEGHTRPVVPDLLFRNGSNILVIEAKFFTHPQCHALEQQLRQQQAAIGRTLHRTGYSTFKFLYLALTVMPLSDASMWPQGFRHMKWSELLEVIKNPVVATNPTRDKTEAFKSIEDGMMRSAQEAQSGAIEVGRVANIELLFKKAPELLKKGYHWVGFDGGLKALTDVSLATLKNRGHYKYADHQHGNNWVPLICVVNRYLKLEEQEHHKQTS